MNESEERWVRMERTMEFLLQSDARLSARLDTTGDRLDTMGDRLDTMGDRLDQMGDRLDQIGDRIAAHQIEIEMVTQAVNSLQIEARGAVTRMLEISEGIASSAVTFSERTVDHERRIRRLEKRLPPDAA